MYLPISLGGIVLILVVLYLLGAIEQPRIISHYAVAGTGAAALIDCSDSSERHA